MNWIYSKWWKWLSVILLFYVILGSFFVKLGPGVTRITPSTFQTDSLYTFRIFGYHSHFNSAKAGKVQLWFKNKDRFFAPTSLHILSDNELEVQFGLGSIQQGAIVPAVFDVVINDDIDGTFALREGLTLFKTETVDSNSTVLASAVQPEVKNNKHQLFCYPYREILYETIRNTFFHVPMWFTMTFLVFASFVGSVLFLWKDDERWDILAHQSVIVALLFGACGYLTGLVWAKYTWYIGVSWGAVLQKLLLEDIKMAAALIAIFFYAGYLVVRGAVTNPQTQRKISAIYSVFAFVVFILCVFVIPRLTDSMHPGNGGNPAFSKYDLDSTLRLFFYPAVIAWVLLGFWILSILIRMNFIAQKQSS